MPRTKKTPSPPLSSQMLTGIRRKLLETLNETYRDDPNYPAFRQAYKEFNASALVCQFIILMLTFTINDITITYHRLPWARVRRITGHLTTKTVVHKFTCEACDEHFTRIGRLCKHLIEVHKFLAEVPDNPLSKLRCLACKTPHDLEPVRINDANRHAIEHLAKVKGEIHYNNDDKNPHRLDLSDESCTPASNDWIMSEQLEKYGVEEVFKEKKRKRDTFDSSDVPTNCASMATTTVQSMDDLDVANEPVDNDEDGTNVDDVLNFNQYSCDDGCGSDYPFPAEGATATTSTSTASDAARKTKKQKIHQSTTTVRSMDDRDVANEPVADIEDLTAVSPSSLDPSINCSSDFLTSASATTSTFTSTVPDVARKGTDQEWIKHLSQDDHCEGDLEDFEESHFFHGSTSVVTTPRNQHTT